MRGDGLRADDRRGQETWEEMNMESAYQVMSGLEIERMKFAERSKTWEAAQVQAFRESLKPGRAGRYASGKEAVRRVLAGSGAVVGGGLGGVR